MLKYILLGVIQGLTEFLPVSSSGHLVILQKLLGLSGQEVVLSVVLHLGTFFAIIIFFFKDILNTLGNRKLLFLILVVTVITGVIGVAAKGFFESLFSAIRPVGFALFITGIVLILTRRALSASRKALNFKDAVILGLTQAVAIIPGISRSGVTISTLLFRRIDREASFKFSFLVCLPAILGATLLEAKAINLALKGNALNFGAGFLASLITGLFALKLLKLVIDKAKLYYFGYYCIGLAIIILLFVK